MNDAKEQVKCDLLLKLKEGLDGTHKKIFPFLPSATFFKTGMDSALIL